MTRRSNLGLHFTRRDSPTGGSARVAASMRGRPGRSPSPPEEAFVNRRWTCMSLALVATMLGLVSAAGAVERSQIPEKYRWDLRDLYPSESAWSAAKQSVARRIPLMDRFRGHLGASAESLYAALSFMMDLERDVSRLGTYASQLADEDIRNARLVAMPVVAEGLGVAYRIASLVVEPENLSVGADRVLGFLAGHPRLTGYGDHAE